MRALIDSQIHLAEVDLDAELRAQVVGELTIVNGAKVTAMDQQVQTAYLMDDHVRLYTADEDWLTIPRGYAHRLDEVARAHGERIEWESSMTLLPPSEHLHRDWRPAPLRGYQAQMRDAMLEWAQTIVQAPTGAGKTRACAEFIRWSGQRALIVVGTTSLARQWEAVFRELYDYQVGFVGEGQRDHRDVTVGLWQSLLHRDPEYEETDYCVVPIHSGERVVAEAVVDPEDLDLASSLRWNLSDGYAQHGSRRDGPTRMHRLLLGLVKGDGVEVDHRNGDRLDNRRCNIRVADRALNMSNRIPNRKTLEKMPQWLRDEWLKKRVIEHQAPPFVRHLGGPIGERRKDGPDKFDSYGTIVLDECHRASSDSLVRLAQRSRAFYRIGLSATPRWDPYLWPIVQAVVGPIGYRVDEADLEQHLVQPSVRIVETGFSAEYLPPRREGRRRLPNNYSEIMSELVTDEARNEQIAAIVGLEVLDGHHVLVQTSRIEHVKLLRERLLELLEDDCVFVLTGKESGKTAERIRAQIAGAEEGTVVLTTVGKEGMDIPRIDRIILAYPIKNTQLVVQIVGRGRRRTAGKDSLIVYDLVDPGCGPLKNQARERQRLYRQQNWPVEKEEQPREGSTVWAR